MSQNFHSKIKDNTGCFPISTRLWFTKAVHPMKCSNTSGNRFANIFASFISMCSSSPGSRVILVIPSEASSKLLMQSIHASQLRPKKSGKPIKLENSLKKESRSVMLLVSNLMQCLVIVDELVVSYFGQSSARPVIGVSSSFVGSTMTCLIFSRRHV